MTATPSISFRWEVIVASLAVGFVGDFAGLVVFALHTSARGTANWVRLIVSSFCIGACGVWSLHFIGMQAMVLDGQRSFSFDATLSVVSLLVAVFGTAGGFAIAFGRDHSSHGDDGADDSDHLHAVGTPAKETSKHEPYTWTTIAVSGLLIGAAASAMHFMGMASMRASLHVEFDHYALLVFSNVIALVCGWVVMFIFLRLFDLLGGVRWRYIVLAAAVMTAGVGSMHYMAMHSATYSFRAAGDDYGHSVLDSDATLSMAIAVVCVVVGVAVAATAYLYTVQQRDAALLRSTTLSALMVDRKGRILLTITGALPSVAMADQSSSERLTDEQSATMTVLAMGQLPEWLSTSATPKRKSTLGLPDSIDESGGEYTPGTPSVGSNGGSDAASHASTWLGRESPQLFVHRFLSAAAALARKLRSPLRNLGHLHPLPISIRSAGAHGTHSLVSSGHVSSMLCFVRRVSSRSEARHLGSIGTFRWVPQDQAIDLLHHSYGQDHPSDLVAPPAGMLSYNPYNSSSALHKLAAVARDKMHKHIHCKKLVDSYGWIHEAIAFATALQEPKMPDLAFGHALGGRDSGTVSDVGLDDADAAVERDLEAALGVKFGGDSDEEDTKDHERISVRTADSVSVRPRQLSAAQEEERRSSLHTSGSNASTKSQTEVVGDAAQGHAQIGGLYVALAAFHASPASMRILTPQPSCDLLPMVRIRESDVLDEEEQAWLLRVAGEHKKGDVSLADPEWRKHLAQDLPDCPLASDVCRGARRLCRTLGGDEWQRKFDPTLLTPVVEEMWIDTKPEKFHSAHVRRSLMAKAKARDGQREASEQSSLSEAPTRRNRGTLDSQLTGAMLEIITDGPPRSRSGTLGMASLNSTLSSAMPGAISIRVIIFVDASMQLPVPNVGCELTPVAIFRARHFGRNLPAMYRDPSSPAARKPPPGGTEHSRSRSRQGSLSSSMPHNMLGAPLSNRSASASDTSEGPGGAVAIINGVSTPQSSRKKRQRVSDLPFRIIGYDWLQRATALIKSRQDEWSSQFNAHAVQSGWAQLRTERMRATIRARLRRKRAAAEAEAEAQAAAKQKSQGGS